LPAVEGRAWITGFHQYVVDRDDPWPAGYVLNDTWGVTGKTEQ
jgi:proline racemase